MHILCWLSRANVWEDASIARRSSSWLCPLHRNEFLLGVPVSVHLIHLQSQSNVRLLFSPSYAEWDFNWGYILPSPDFKLTQTMRSQTSSLPSSPCRITIAYSIARRSARCSLLSRFFHSVDGISVVTHNDIEMFGVGSIPWSPLARGALTRPLGQQTSRGQADWQVFRCLHVVTISRLFTGSLGIMPKHRHTKLLLTGMPVFY